MSGLHFLLNKYLNNTPPLKSLGKTPLEQQSGTFAAYSLHFRELLPFKVLLTSIKKFQEIVPMTWVVLQKSIRCYQLSSKQGTDIFVPTVDHFLSEMLSASLRNSSNVRALLCRWRHLLFPPLQSSFFPHSACIFDACREVGHNRLGQISNKYAGAERQR